MNRGLRTALRLGRVSNLPTVWTNVLAGAALNGARPEPSGVVPVALAMSLSYVAGMYLNDAFDWRWDAEHRPERPIVAGEVSVRVVFLAGLLMLAGSLAILLAGPGGRRTLLAGLVLAALVVLYDVSHKKTAFAPVIMGLCRVAVYITAALAVAPVLAPAVYVGSALLLAYLILLSALARRETRDPRLPRLVGLLIAGISLVDGAELAVLGHLGAACVCVAAFFATRWAQRHIAGT